MTSPVKKQLSQMPGLLPRLRRGRYKLNRGLTTTTEWMISARRGYEILVVFGMRRSGNHVAINWILNQVNGAAAFYNNINPAGPPYAARMTEYRLRAGGAGPRIILSYEDVSPETMLAPPLLDYLADRTARDRAGVRFALVLRDPYNMFASRLRKWPERFSGPGQIDEQIRLYTRLSALAEAPRPIWQDAPLVPLLYNDLVSDPTTRKRLAGALGIRSGDRGLDHVPSYGHGSSFDGTALSADAMRNQIFERWRGLAGNPAFDMVAGHPDIRKIGRDLFSMSPPDQR